MKPPPIHYRRCPECDATSDPAAVRCWLCGGPLGVQDEVVGAELVAEPGVGDALHEKLFAGLGILTGVLTLLLILGAWDRAPGIAIVVAVCAGPALVATVVRTLGRQARGLPFRWQTTLSTFFLSMAAALLILCLLAVGLVIALIVLCFAVIYSIS